jgi:hypothetical protein
MTDEITTEIQPDDVGWDEAVVQEGRQPGSVVSVRLSPGETVQLRIQADKLGVTVSEVLRRALAAFEPPATIDAHRKVLVSVFTYGASMPALGDDGWVYSGSQQLWAGQTLAWAGTGAPTATEPTRIVERVTTDPAHSL